MSARVPPGFAEIWIQFGIALDSEPMYSAIGVDLSVGTTVGTTEADGMLDAAKSALAPMVSSTYNIGPGFVVQGQDGGDVRVDGTSAATAGTHAGAPLPNNCAILFRKVTAAGGRRHRGRMYIPGVAETSVGESGILAPALQTIANTAALALRTNLVALATVDTLQLFHQSDAFVPTEITTLTAQNRIATQRRRMRP